MTSFDELDDNKQLYEKLESALDKYPQNIMSAPDYVPEGIFEENYIPEEIVDMIISMASDGFDPGKYGLRSFQRKWIIELGKKLIENIEVKNEENIKKEFIKATYIGTKCIPDTDWDYGVTIKKREYEELNQRVKNADSSEITYVTEHTMFNPQLGLPRAEKIIPKGTRIIITTADIAKYEELISSNDIYEEATETIDVIKESNIFCDNIITILDKIKIIHPELYLKKVSYEILQEAMKSIDRTAVVPYTSQFRYAFYLQQIAYELVHSNTTKLSNIVIRTLEANGNRTDHRDKHVARTATHAADLLDTLLPPTAAIATGSSSVSKKKTKKRKRAKKRRSRRKV